MRSWRAFCGVSLSMLMACSGGDTDDSGPSVVCGDGRVDAAETCDGASCPTSCDDSDPCTTDALVGDPAECSAACVYEPIAECAEASCGDGTVDPGEACDDGPANGSSWSATPHCNGDCTAQAPHCGDGLAQPGEEACGEPGLSACGAGLSCSACACGPCLARPDPALTLRVDIDRILELVPVGDKLFVVVQGIGLQVLDYSDPSSPALLGAHELSDAQAVAVVGDHAFLVGESSGLTVLDVSTPSSPTPVGAYASAYSTDVAAAGTYVYLGGTTLEVIDVSDPAAPTLAGTLDEYVSELVIDGTYVYLTGLTALTGFGGLKVVDVVDPSAPVVVGSYALSRAGKLALAAGIAAIAGEDDDVLELVDVTVPTSPAWLGSYQAPNTIVDIAMTAGLAYVAYGNFPMGMHVVEVDATPAQVGTASVSVPTAVGADAGGVYLAGSRSGYPDLPRLYAYDTNLVSLSTYTAPSDARAIALDAGTAYVADARELHTFDLASAGGMRRLGDRFHGYYAAEVTVGSGLLHLVAAASQSCSFDGYLRTYDVSDAANPVQVGLGLNFSTACPSDVAATGDHVYFVDDEIRVVSVATPAAPAEVGLYTPYAEAMVIEGSIAYVAGATGLEVLDLAAPASPVLLGAQATPTSPTGVAVFGGFAYVTASTSGVHVFDVSDPSNPSLVGSLATPDVATGVAVVTGDTILVANGNDVAVVDVSDPSSPAMVGTFVGSAPVRDVAYANGFAYVAADERGVLVLSVCE